MNEALFRRIRPWLLATDVGMLLYWTLTAAFAVGLVDLPAELLFSDYDNPVVTSWNWSFLPLDIAFSVSGLGAALLFRVGRSGWQLLTLASLFLTFCAGLMAISFWAVRCEFDPVWWVLNGVLIAWPLWFLRDLARAMSLADASVEGDSDDAV